MEQRKKTKTYEEIINWINEHNGKKPRSSITMNGKKLLVSEMNQKQLYEVRLRRRWEISKIKKIYEMYQTKDIDEVPIKYSDKVAYLREYLDISIYDIIIEWLETHNGKMPRSDIFKNGRRVSQHDMTDEEKEELKLYRKWRASEDYKILKKYKEADIEVVPEKYREKIKKLREYPVGKTIYSELMAWLNEHNGEMPRGTIGKKGKKLTMSEMTKSEKQEVVLYKRWLESKMAKIYNRYKDEEIENIPEEYRKKIENLRRYLKKDICEEVIKWLENNDKKMPRKKIIKNSRALSKEEMNDKEKMEMKLAHRWLRTPERRILNEYAGRNLEEIPEEYREKIKRLRELGQLGRSKDMQMTKKMIQSVSKNVSFNEDVRAEILGKEKKLPDERE